MVCTATLIHQDETRRRSPVPVLLQELPYLLESETIRHARLEQAAYNMHFSQPLTVSCTIYTNVFLPVKVVPEN